VTFSFHHKSSNFKADAAYIKNKYGIKLFIPSNTNPKKDSLKRTKKAKRCSFVGMGKPNQMYI